MKDYIRELWLQIPPPREATVLMAGVYTLAIVQGVWSFLMPSDGAEYFDQIVRVWLLLLLSVGGFIGLVSLPWGIWMLEKAGIFTLLAVDIAHLSWVLLDVDNNGMAEPGKFCRLAMLMLFLMTRYVRIRGRDLDPLRTGAVWCHRERGAGG